MQRPDNVTPWFDKSVKPARVGWYDVINVDPATAAERCPEVPNFVELSYFRKWWDGRRWKYRTQGPTCVIQKCWWRGRDSEV